jgi:glycosyltransferase A (GT-A) superfamily protein (DUF2064 family)
LALASNNEKSGALCPARGSQPGRLRTKLSAYLGDVGPVIVARHIMLSHILPNHNRRVQCATFAAVSVTSVSGLITTLDL